MYFDDFTTKLKKGDPANAVLLFGDADSVIAEGMNLIKENFKKTKPEGIVQTFDGTEHEMLDIISAAQSSGLFSTSQLLIFRNAQKDKCLGGRSDAAQKLLQSYFENPNMDSYLVFLAPGMKKTVGAVKTMERLGWVVQCADMPDWKLAGWVKQQAQNRGLTMNEEACQWLVQKVGTDIAYLQRALEQLADYVYPDKTICAEHVKELAVPGVESEIFPFLDAVAQRQTDKALKLMATLSEGIDTGTTMMLYGRMRELLMVASAKTSGISQSQAAEALGMNPWRLKNVWDETGHYTVEELKAAIQDLIHIQAGVVTGRLTKTVPAVMLEWWVLKWGKNKMAGARR